METLRDVIGDGLYTSISQVKTYLKCPRQFELRYVRGAEPEFVPTPLAFGIAFHTALGGYYRALKDRGEEIPTEALVELFRDEWEAKKAGPVPLQAEGDDAKEDLVDLAARMLGKFHEHAAAEALEVEAVELPFGVSIPDPDTGELLDEKLVGVIDLVVREEGRLVVVEHKTAARKYAQDQLLYDLQPTAYQLALRETGAGDVGLRFQVVTKTKTPAVQVEDVVRGEADEDDFRRTALGVLRAVDAGAFYPVRGWQCRSCPYRSRCSKRG